MNCAVLGLAKQFMVRNAAGRIKPNQFYDQLLMLHRVLPMLTCDKTEETRRMSSTRMYLPVVTSF